MNQKLKMREKISYGLGDVGCNFVWTTMSMFLTVYYTDSVGIGAAVVGTLMLLTRLMDGVTDLFFGVVLDRTRTKLGKARPWILISMPMMAIGLILVFNVPGRFGKSGQVVYAAITYVFITCIAYTISNLSYNALLSLMTDSAQERASVSSIRFFMVTVMAVVIASATTPLSAKIGYGAVAVIYAVVSALCFLATVFGTKERITEQKEEKKGVEEKAPVGEQIRLLFQNKFFFPILLLFVVAYIKSGVSSGIGIYFMKDVLGNANLMGVFSLVGTVPMMIGLAVFPNFVKRFGKWRCLQAGALLSLIASAITVAFSTNIPVVIACTIVNGIGGVPLSAGLFALVSDGVTYGEWKNGVRQDGMFNSVVSFGMKVGTGLGTAMIGWGLELGHYDGTLAEQSSGAVRAIVLTGYGIPVICMILALACLRFCNIDKIYPQMEKDLAERRGLAG